MFSPLVFYKTLVLYCDMFFLKKYLWFQRIFIFFRINFPFATVGSILNKFCMTRNQLLYIVKVKPRINFKKNVLQGYPSCIKKKEKK